MVLVFTLGFYFVFNYGFVFKTLAAGVRGTELKVGSARALNGGLEKSELNLASDETHKPVSILTFRS